MILPGYAGLIVGAREFIADLDGNFLEGSTIVFAPSLYAGAALLGLGAYRMSQTD